jgi:hypothetical protein
MARPLRIEFPGVFYHVMNRGNTGMDIYRSERDREKFLEYVGEAVKRYGIKVHKQRWMYWLFEAKKRFGLCVLNFTIYWQIGPENYLDSNFSLEGSFRA